MAGEKGKPMHPLDVTKEWRKGCSVSLKSDGTHDHPSVCTECTEAAMKAIENYFAGSTGSEGFVGGGD